MAKSEKQKITEAIKAPSKLKKEKTIEVISKNSLKKPTKIIVSQANKKNSGSYKSNPITEAEKKKQGTSYTFTKNLEKAAKVSAKTGENVQNIRSRIKTDIAKTAMRAKMIETRNKNKKK